ncbi:hypothetical protein LTR85_005170 [Meristemomyces frigidus]|nr:hypothetical protein LTR85_005170 [Meristemomyces frigidus]
MSDTSKSAGEQTQQQASSWMGSIQNAAGGVVGTAGGIVGGAVNTAGGAVGNVGRGLGKTLTDASNSVESTAKGTSEQINESTGAKQQGKAQK